MQSNYFQKYKNLSEEKKRKKTKKGLRNISKSF